jgi:hypothetical protein
MPLLRRVYLADYALDGVHVGHRYGQACHQGGGRPGGRRTRLFI